MPSCTASLLVILSRPPFLSYVLISLLVRAIFFVSSFQILYPLHFLICPRILLVVYLPKPLSDLDLRTDSKITCKVISEGDEDNYIHSKPNCSLFICIQRYSWKYHKRNISLLKRLRLTYPDGNITSSTIIQGSHFPPTSNNHQCTTILFHLQNTLSLI